MIEYDTEEPIRGPALGHKRGKLTGPDHPHIPNKAERKLLTKLMKASGESEEKVRSVKANRVKLAEAAKESTKCKNGKKTLIKRMRALAASKTGVPAYHPAVIKYVDRLARKCWWDAKRYLRGEVIKNINELKTIIGVI